MIDNNTDGFLVAIDGPNGAGKSTLIEMVKDEMVERGYDVYITKEPTNTQLGEFVRDFSEKHYGISLACLVTADRYEHIENEIFPKLKQGKLVITDRYVLSTLILQPIDGVSNNFIFELNSEIIKPDLQVAVFADEEVLQNRLKDREVLTRFEKGKHSITELGNMKSGVAEMLNRDVCILQINNTDNLVDNVEKIVYHIINNWRKR